MLPISPLSPGHRETSLCVTGFQLTLQCIYLGSLWGCPVGVCGCFATTCGGKCPLDNGWLKLNVSTDAGDLLKAKYKITSLPQGCAERASTLCTEICPQLPPTAAMCWEWCRASLLLSPR